MRVANDIETFAGLRMNYVIDMRVRYRPNDGVLWLVDDDSSAITLTVMMNRLFLFLLERRGSTITRDEILAEVWDAWGLRSSNNTLNKYISELRRIFSVFGVSAELIVTVPRVGYMFNGDVDVQSDGESSLSKMTREEDDGERKTRKTWKKLMLLLMAGLLVVANYLMFSIASNSNTIPKKQSATPKEYIFSFDGCPVYTVRKNAITLSGSRETFFIELLRSKGMTCHAGESFLLTPSDAYLYTHSGRVFIARCAKDDKAQHFSSCMNYYWSGDESQ